MYMQYTCVRKMSFISKNIPVIFHVLHTRMRYTIYKYLACALNAHILYIRLKTLDAIILHFQRSFVHKYYLLLLLLSNEVFIKTRLSTLIITVNNNY